MAVVGPIAHTVAELRFFFQTVLAAEPWFSDPKCIEIPWRQDRADNIKSRKLTFGIIEWDRLVMPHPPVQRGVKMVRDALKAQGHEIIEFDVPDVETVNSLTVPSLDPYPYYILLDHIHYFNLLFLLFL
jgi:amidase